MHYIHCPYCKKYFDESEFSHGGELRETINSSSCTDQEWAEYLFVRKNSKGSLKELWLHLQGCMRWFRVERNTLSHEIISAIPLND